MAVLNKVEDLVNIREAGKIIREIFSWLGNKAIKPGVNTYDLDREVENIIEEMGALPAFKGYKGFPATICASVNDVVVHGIPSKAIRLKEGDIIGVDVGVNKNGLFADAARTYPVGKVSAEAESLITATRKSLAAGIKKATAGNRIGDISNAIQEIAEKAGYQEVRMFVGHGIGRHLHEAPEVPNWGAKNTGPVLRKAQALAIEPMINSGTRNVRVLQDGWTAVTDDGRLSAHFEDTVIVWEDKAEIIT